MKTTPIPGIFRMHAEPEGFVSSFLELVFGAVSDFYQALVYTQAEIKSFW